MKKLIIFTLLVSFLFAGQVSAASLESLINKERKGLPKLIVSQKMVETSKFIWMLNDSNIYGRV